VPQGTRSIPALALVLEQACLRHASRTALCDEHAVLSYGELLDRSRALADVLRAAGMTPGLPVMVMSSNHPLDVVAWFGIWLAGGVAVPVHRTAPPGVVQGIQAKARCRFAVDLDAAASTGLRVLPMAPPGEHGASAQALLQDAALVIFTSGSTGLPKGVVLSHAAFMGKLQQNQALLGLSPHDVCLLVLNNTFSFGIWIALLTLWQGGRLVMRSRFSPPDFLQDLVEQGISFTGVVPTMIRATFGTLTTAEPKAARQRPGAASLRQMVIGGEVLGTDLSRRLRDFIQPAQLFDVYGLTETSTSDFVLLPQDYRAHPDSIGRAAGGVIGRIVDDDGQACPPGHSGELQLRTPYIMAGYLGDEALTQAAFTDGWFRTGDLGTCDTDGFVHIVGRLKELVVRGGNKIAPAEIERALAQCPGVAAAMVAGLPDPVLGQRIQALLIAQAGAVIDAGTLRAHLASSLEKFKHPDACYIGTALPTGRTGKLERSQLPTLIAAQSVQALPGWAS